MQTIFDVIDSWKFKANIFVETAYVRKVALVFILSVIPLWLVFGFDSGIVQLEKAVLNLPMLWNGNSGRYFQLINEAYGKSFHFSSYIIYGILFILTSKHLETLNIKKSRNLFYTLGLVLFNIALFEWIYMVCLVHFQLGRSLVEWFINDFWFLMNYMLLLFAGVLALVFLYDDVKGKTKFQSNSKLAVLGYFTVACWLLWVFYPGQVVTVQYNGWISSMLFPQTHYAYVNAELYVVNDLLHLLNLLTKTFFMLTQAYLLKSVKSK